MTLAERGRLASFARALGKLVPFLSLLLFLAVSSPRLELPGLNYDEAFDAVPAMQLLLGQRVETVRGAGIQIGGLTFPLMVMDYKGAVHTYWALPFLWALGVRVFSLRLSCLFLSLLAVAFTYRFVREVYGSRVAAGTVLLMAVNPPFVFWSRQGVLWTTAMLACGMGALAAFSGWPRRGQRWRLFCGALLLGLGLSAKAAFVWFPVALVLSVTVLELAKVRGDWRELSRLGDDPRLRFRCAQLVGVGLLGLLLGLLPLLLYNLQTGGTLRVVLENLHTSYYGVDNLNYLANLKFRWSHLTALLEGSGFWYLGGVQRDPILPLAFWLSLGVTLAHSLYATVRWHGSEGPGFGRAWTAASERVGAGRYRLLPIMMLGLMFLQSGATVSGLWPEHYLLLLPFPQLIIALGLDMVRRARSKMAAAWVSSLIVLALVSGQLRVDAAYHSVLAQRGGFSAHSDGVYRLVEFLERRDGPIVSMDWGIRAAVQFLTEGQIDPVERFGFGSLAVPSESFALELAPHLADEDTLYVFHAPEETVYQGRQQALEGLMGQRGLILDEKRTIYDRSARPLFLVMAADEE